MKRTIFGHLAPILLVFGTSTAVMAQSETTPAHSESGFPCEINTGAVGGSDILTTFDSSRLCTGSLTNENIKITCVAELPTLSTASGTSNDFACTISTGPCGVPAGTPELVESTGESMSVLDIDGDGDLDVEMICHWN